MDFSRRRPPSRTRNRSTHTLQRPLGLATMTPRVVNEGATASILRRSFSHLASRGKAGEVYRSKVGVDRAMADLLRDATLFPPRLRRRLGFDHSRPCSHS